MIKEFSTVISCNTILKKNVIQIPAVNSSFSILILFLILFVNLFVFIKLWYCILHVSLHTSLIKILELLWYCYPLPLADSVKNMWSKCKKCSQLLFVFVLLLVFLLCPCCKKDRTNLSRRKLLLAGMLPQKLQAVVIPFLVLSAKQHSNYPHHHWLRGDILLPCRRTAGKCDSVVSIFGSL